MSEQRRTARPRQVTVGAGTAIAGSVVLLVVLFETMGRLRTVEVRDGIATFLTTPPGDGLGLTVDEVLRVLRALVLFNGAVAAVAVVCAGYVLTRHRGARVALTAAAALLLLSAAVTTGPLPVVVAIGVAMLWTRPARDWFAGREATAAAEGPPRPGRSAPPVPPPDPGAGGSPTREPDPSWPPPAPGSGTPPNPAWPQPQAPEASPVPFGYAARPSVPMPPVQQEPELLRRPPAVTVAAVLTWVFAGLTAAGCLLAMLTLVVARDRVVSRIEGSADLTSTGMSTQDLLAVAWVTCAVAVVWSLLASVLAVLVVRRVNAARIGLAVSCAGVAVASIPLLTALGLGLVFMVGSLATAWLLLSRPAAHWCRATRSPRSPRPPADVW